MITSSSKKVLFLLGFLISLWGVGFLRFYALIPDKVMDKETRVDAIVVLTGEKLRLQTGVFLHRKELGRFLLISGVNPKVTRDSFLYQTAARDEGLTLDYEAFDTQTNAIETAKWVTAHNIKTLRVVTADYHMPRSMLELKSLLPETKMIPHPVFPHEKMQKYSLQRLRILVQEYNKYLLCQLKHLGHFKSWLFF